MVDMGMFGWFGEAAVPQWAAFSKPEEYKSFIFSVEGYFKNRDLPYVIEYDTVTVNGQKYGLQDLSQNCAQLAIKYYPEFIENYFDELLNRQSFKI